MYYSLYYIKGVYHRGGQSAALGHSDHLKKTLQRPNLCPFLLRIGNKNDKIRQKMILKILLCLPDIYTFYWTFIFSTGHLSIQLDKVKL